MNQEVLKLFKQKKFDEFDCDEISKVLWKMDLAKYQSVFEMNQINGSVVAMVDDESLWKKLGLSSRECFCFSYYSPNDEKSRIFKNIFSRL